MLKRRATIEVHNKTRYVWQALNATFSSGTSQSVLPANVVENEIVEYTGVQRSFSLFTGTAGVFTYSILNNNGQHWKTLVVMWDVPFDYNIWKSNYWNARVTDRAMNDPANLDLFWRLRNRRTADPVKGADQWHQLASDNFTIKRLYVIQQRFKVDHYS